MDFSKLVEADIKSMSTPSEQAERIIAASTGGLTDEKRGVESVSGFSTQKAETDNPTAGTSDAAGPRDNDGNLFDPSLHATDEDGNPRLTKSGKLRKKPGRSSTGSASASSTKKVSRELGRTTAETIFYVSQAAFGDEWTPIYNKAQGIDERTQMIEAWASYYEATGQTEVPPWVGVVIATSCYALPRLNQPKTKSRLAHYFGVIKSAVIKRKKTKGKKDAA